MIAILVIGLLAADHSLCKPMKAEELRREEEHRAQCLLKFSEIQKSGGDAAREQYNGSLVGCDFGAPLG